MTAFATFRERVATALAPPVDAEEPWTVSAGPVDSFTPPGYLLSWGDEWGMPATFCDYLVRLDVIAISFRIDPDPGLETLERLVEGALIALRDAGLPEASFSAPSRFDIGGVPYLASRISLALPLALTPEVP